MVEAGETVRDQDWQLLANSSWGQDQGRALGERDIGEVYTLLAEACPARLAVEKSQLQMMTIDHWVRDEERDTALAATYLEQVNAVLGDDTLSRANLVSFVFSGGQLVKTLAEGEEQLALRDRILSRLEAAIANDQLNVLLRLDAIYGWQSDGLIKSEADRPTYMPDANPGNIRYMDQNGDGELNELDVVIIGNYTPRWVIGLNNTVTWQVKALVDATPISGPACKYTPRPASRAIVDPTTLHNAAT